MTLRAKIRLAGSLGACCAAGAVAGLLAPHRTVASLVPGDPGEVGVTFGVYSYRDALCTEEADPINVIFLGNWQTVQAHAAHHGDWTTCENNQQYFFDHGHCSPNQADASSNSASLPGEQRFHMRLRTSSTDSAGTIYDADPYRGIWTGATAHHEQRTVTGDCTKPQGEHAVDDQTVSGGSGIFAYEGGYNRARADILYNWTTLGIGNHIPEADLSGTIDEDWGNTDPMTQCNGNVAWSDGFVYFIQANAPFPPPGPTPVPPPPPPPPCTGKC